LQPGILAEANQNILYVDEINLLPDHIVDDILDAAASGWNIIEREGISVSHPSRFILVGTMNPEEGELRPQLLDRLPLSVTIRGIRDEDLRIEVIRRNIEFSENPIEFRKKYEEEQNKLKERIIKARELLEKVEVPEPILRAVARLCLSLNVDGHRPDIVIIQAAKALAAFSGRTAVEVNDIKIAAKLALSHRTRRGGFEEPASSDEIEQTLNKVISSLKDFFVQERIKQAQKESELPIDQQAQKAYHHKKEEKEFSWVKTKKQILFKRSTVIALKKTKRWDFSFFRRKAFSSLTDRFKPKGQLKIGEKIKTIRDTRTSDGVVLRKKASKEEEKVMIEIPSIGAALIDVSKSTRLDINRDLLEKRLMPKDIGINIAKIKTKVRLRTHIGKSALAIVSVNKGEL